MREPIRKKGPWSTDQIQHFLGEIRIPIRIACNGASGHPVMASLWFVPQGGMLWCATQQGASVVSLLTRDPRCAFEVSVETSLDALRVADAAMYKVKRSGRNGIHHLVWDGDADIP